MSEKGLKILSTATGNVRYKLTNDYLFRAVLQRSPKALRGLVGALLNLQQEDIKSVEITNPIILGEQIDETVRGGN